MNNMDNVDNAETNVPVGEASSSDAMKARAESVAVPTKVQGKDGRQWAESVQADPMRTLPPGAGWLIVHYYENRLP